MNFIYVNNHNYRAEEGFTLIEVLISLAILSIGILAVASLQITASMQSRNSFEITEASAIASYQMEDLMSIDYSDLEIGTHLQYVDKYGYEVTTDGDNVKYIIERIVSSSYLNTDGVVESKTIDLTVARKSTSTNQREINYRFIKNNPE